MDIREIILDQRSQFQDELDDLNVSIKLYYGKDPNITILRIIQQKVTFSHTLMEKIDLLNDILDKIDCPKGSYSRKSWYWENR